MARAQMVCDGAGAVTGPLRPNPSIGRDSVMREASLRHDIKRSDKNKCGYTDVALAGDDGVPE